ncbi:putative Bacterial type II secretion system pr [Prochlorococcus sp. MIT 0603]|nr:putative Bacterial type II secretion system pr [Prochlorococcus sp. MIT 0603]
MLLLPISIVALTTSTLIGSITNAGSQGVDIYCVMRNGGNDHASSWQAAYQSIKNERGGLFKISPRQAATIIVQQVVGSQDKYSDCTKYLGELYPKAEEELTSTTSNGKGQPTKQDQYMDDRYDY